MTSAVPTSAATVPARMASAPRSAPTVRSSMMVSVAGSAPERSSSACSWVCWVVKLAGDDAAAAADRALHDRRADDLVVELDRQPLADVGARGGAEGAAAGGIEGEADDRPAALLLLEGRLGVVEILAAHDHALEHRQALRLVAPADLLGREPRIGALDLLPRLGIGRRAAPACPRASAPGRWSAAGWPGRSGRSAPRPRSPDGR